MAIMFQKGGKPAPVPTAAPKPAGAVPSYMKTGTAAKATLDKEEAKAEQRRAEQGLLWRFWLKAGTSTRITFLDGNLDEAGILGQPTWYEHRVMLDGDWENLVCIAEQEPCPICEAGDNNAFVMGLTVIDHSTYTVTKGKNAGKVYVNRPKLFIAKRTTIKQLQKIAEKHGGLAGCTFEVDRTSDQVASVGDLFTFEEKHNLADVIAKYTTDPKTPPAPADWGKEIIYRTRKALLGLGIGTPQAVIGAEKTPDTAAMANQL